ncbi:hypothetical protein GCM10028820_17230 [Tessaracoccus terricola]
MIINIYCEARGNPRVRCVHAALAALGHRLGPKRVWRLMKTAGLQGRHPKAWKRTTIHGEDPAPDLIGRCFTAEEPNQKWCGDITYVRTWEAGAMSYRRSNRGGCGWWSKGTAAAASVDVGGQGPDRIRDQAGPQGSRDWGTHG